ncbi:galactokinase [Thermococcus sp.]
MQQRTDSFGVGLMYTAVSPGRVNLIGEHTDYSFGYVMPVAVNLHTKIEGDAFEHVELYSEHFEETRFFKLDRIKKEGSWMDYVRAIYWVLAEEGLTPKGIKGRIGGNLPVDSGLSSSASFELAVMALLNEIYGLGLSPQKMALLAQKAENEFIGVPCGIMDQFIIAMGKEGHAMFLDTETLEHEYVPIPEDIQVLVFHTGVRRTLTGSAYADRRKMVVEVLRRIGRESSKCVEERDLRGLPGIYRRRFGYIIRENRRVVMARDALKSGDMETFGRILTEAHLDIARNYGVSCGELDYIVRKAVEFGAYGARLTGAGFGGAAIAVVDRAKGKEIGDRLLLEYSRAFRWKARYFLVEASQGVEVFRG